MKVVPIEGVVKYKGNPLADANIAFYPAKGPVGSAKSDTKGGFQIRTNGQLGGVPGKYKVTVGVAQSSAIPPSDGRAHEHANKSTVPIKYASEADSDLSVEVAPTGTRDLQLDLTD